MRRIQDANVGPGNTFISADPGTNTPGTIVRKDHKNDTQEELCRAIESTGEIVDTTLYSAGDGNRDQISQAMAHYGAGGGSYYDESVTSAANVYVVEMEDLGIRVRQSPQAYFDGMQVEFITTFNNTGASTINVNGLGVKNIKLKGGTDPAAGDITARVQLVFDSVNNWFELQIGPDTSGFADTDLSNLSTLGDQKTAKAWVNFNGTGTIAIRDSFGVSSLSDYGIGWYAVTFSSSFPSANHCPVASGYDSTRIRTAQSFAQDAGSAVVVSFDHSGAALDLPNLYLVAFGD